MLKRIIAVCFIGMCFLLSVSAQENIIVFIDSYVNPKKKFIDSLAVADGIVKPYERFATSVATIRSGRDKEYQVRLSKFKNGEYPGDFQAIQIFLGNNCLLEVTNADGWTSLPPNVPTTNPYYFAVGISAYSTALFFFSQPKDNIPPDLTIIVIKTGKAHLVFHRPCVLQSLSKNSYSVRLEMDDSYPVYVATGDIIEEAKETPVDSQPEEIVSERPKKKRKKKSIEKEIAIDTVSTAITPEPVVEVPSIEPVQPKRYLIWSADDVLKIKEE